LYTHLIEEGQLAAALERNEAFWEGNLAGSPLMWVTVPDARTGNPPAQPRDEAARWTDVEHLIAAAHDALDRTYYAGDALPIHHPWLGPDQVAAWLGAEMSLDPGQNTSWVKPLLADWSDYSTFSINPDNYWWKLYLELLQASVREGAGKWITAYPDLHTGIDGLSAIRGTEDLLIDLVEVPEQVKQAMRDMTRIFNDLVDQVSEIILPAGQGTSNSTMGWSEKRFLCIGQNDFTCMISPQMFEEFCLQDTVATCNHVDYAMYHLDGPDAVRHLPQILEIKNLDCVQWIHGAGQPPASAWLDLLKTIQAAGKSVQVFYGPAHGDDADLTRELQILCRELDPTRLFFWAIVSSVEEADHLIRYARCLC
jgi:hypothetical protein